MIEIEVGTVLYNPRTREYGRALVLDEERFVGELIAAPGGAVAGAHRHPGQDERFEVISGLLGYRAGGEYGTLGPGASVTVPRGVVHDWWNAGDADLHARVTVTPPGSFAHAIAVAWGLAALGRTDAKGMPTPLDGALLLEAFGDTLEFEHPPRWVQRALARFVAPLARARGRTIDDEALQRAAIVEPSRWPAAAVAAAR